MAFTDESTILQLWTNLMSHIKYLKDVNNALVQFRLMEGFLSSRTGI